MFDLRLGLALGKSLNEIRSLPNPELALWRAYYLLEPWGWPNEEFQVARILTMLWNRSVDRSKQKSPTFWIRNMLQQAVAAFSREQRAQSPDFIDMDTPEGKQKATERMVEQFKAMFGARIKDKRKQ